MLDHPLTAQTPEEVYDASTLDCYAFRRGSDVRRGLSLALGNMVAGFGFDLQGVHFHNSECAYIAGMFSLGTPEHTAVVRQLVACDDGWEAKKKIRKAHEQERREDWLSFNVPWMHYLVWQKCLTSEAFRKLLLAFPSEAILLEDSTYATSATATKWGMRNAELRRRLTAMKRELTAQGMNKTTIKREQDKMRLGEWSTIGEWRGQNLLGKILMDCRDAMRYQTEPLIDYAPLRAVQIDLLGQELTFPTY